MNSFANTDGTDASDDDATGADYEETNAEMMDCLCTRAIANFEQSVERTIEIAHDPRSEPLAVIEACRVLHTIGADFIKSQDKKSEVADLEARNGRD